MDRKIWAIRLVGVCWLVVLASEARAITSEVAKKCQVLTSAAFPPRVPGNPAAGSAKGSGREQQDYFKKCVASGGQPPDRDQGKNSK
jgi:hypothetical protein